MAGHRDAPPAATAISANSSTVMGASSLGLTMTEFPAASAGAIFLSAMRRGWLNGCEVERASVGIAESGEEEGVWRGAHGDLCDNT